MESRYFSEELDLLEFNSNASVKSTYGIAHKIITQYVVHFCKLVLDISSIKYYIEIPINLNWI